MSTGTPPANSLAAYEREAILRNGSSIHVRALRPADKARLVEHFERLSPRSIYLRFFGVKKRLTDEDLARFTELDFVRSAALAATLRDDGGEHIIGIARYMAADGPAGGPIRAEVAFAVLDPYQGQGVGTLLLEHLAIIARANDIGEFEASVLGENNRMLAMFATSGFRVKRALEEGIFHVVFPTEPTEQFLTKSRDRERVAAAQSVRRLLNPRAVAVVGASRRAGSIGAALLGNLQRDGFTGAIYPINPGATEINGLRCYPTVSAIGAPVDLAIIAVPAARVDESVADCARAGVHGVVVISSGFAETEGGREAQQRLTQLVRGSGMRMVGPNCMGLLNTDPAIALNGTFAPTWPPTGTIGMLSQSGALGLAILDYAHTRHLGLSTFVSVGNKADVSGNDLLAYWSEDPRTQVVMLYLESFGNPRTFAQLAPEVSRVKPIVALKAGRSAAGRRAATSHSAALANLDVAVDALFAQAGVIRANTMEELFDIATLLSAQPLPAGPRVGVITNAGGPGILLADACEAQGLTLPALAAATIDELRSFLPPQAGYGNPIDCIAAASPAQYQRAVAAVGCDPNVDALIVVYIPPFVTNPEEIAAAIGAGAGAVPGDKPILSVFISSHGTPAILDSGPRGRIPSYTFPENAAGALAAAVRHKRWRDAPRGTVLGLSRFAQDAIRAVVDRVLASANGPQWVTPTDLATILAAAGIRTAVAQPTTVSEAAALADELGYPLVAKAIAPAVLHKTDLGGVVLGLRSAAEVAAAARSIAASITAAGATLEGILLQREVVGGIEALVGVTTDPVFGPLLVCGLGGVLVELQRDVVFRLPPVSDTGAREMLASLRAAALLDGYRGAPAGDREALVNIIRRISALVEIVPEMRELDLNPVKVLAPGAGAVVVDGRMRLAPGESRF